MPFKVPLNYHCAAITLPASLSIPAPKGIKAVPLNTRFSLCDFMPFRVQPKTLPLPTLRSGSSSPSASTSAEGFLTRHPLPASRAHGTDCSVPALYGIVPAPKGVKAAPSNSSGLWTPALPVLAIYLPVVSAQELDRG